MAIYIRAGREIFKKRKKMLNFSGSGTVNGTAVNPDTFSPTNHLWAPAFKTTEVVQTTEIIQQAAITPAAGLPDEPGPTKNANVSYSVTISADAPTKDDDDSINDALEMEPPAAAAQSSNPNARVIAKIQTMGSAHIASLQARRRMQRTMEAHHATWSYTKCAILFFSVLLITWIPSSGNRVYSLINHGEVSKPLFYASAFVLPLQGFWNAIIYMVTSWTACKSFAANILDAVLSRRGRPIVEITAGRHRETRPTGGTRWHRKEETTSMEDLTGSSRTLLIDRGSPV